MKKETVRAGSLKEIKIAALMMLVFGFAEVVSGMTHRFLALTIENSRLAAVMGVTIGLLYLASGLLLLNGKKWTAVLAIAFLAVHIAGRVAMIVMGLYRVDTVPQILGIVLGTSIAVYFAGLVCLKFKSFK